MIKRRQLRRVAADARLLGSGLIDPYRCWASKCVLLFGLAYPLGPIDLIPNRLPVIGYLDQVAFVLGGIALAYLLLPVSTGAPWGGLTTRLSARGRAWVLDGFAAAFAVPMLRLATGAWPVAGDVAAFRRAFRRFTPLPPLMRALATVPAGREQLTRAMLASWLLADETYRGRLQRELSADDARPGNPLRVWSGPPVTFLHLEKTGGMAVVAALAAEFHPLQIDADPRRAHPPHLFCPLPPFLVARVRRCALVWGHYDLPSIRRLGDGRFTFTMLREPCARIRSLYRYWRGQAALGLGWDGMNQPVLMAQRLDFAAFLQAGDPMVVNYIDNFYVRRLTGQYATDGHDPLADDPDGWLQAALEGLESLDFVGLTEDTDGALEVLGRQLGFAAPDHVKPVNVTWAAPPTATPVEDAVEIESRLARLTSLDRAVYAAASRRYLAEAVGWVSPPLPADVR